MKNDPAGAIGALIFGAIEKMAATLSVSFPCRIISYDAGSGMATIQPLIRKTDSDPAPILNVPVLGQRFLVDGVERVYTPALHAGDTVLVVCTDNELKNALNGQIAVTNSKRSHDHNDAVIVGVFSCSLLS
ncbi:hypothetical protein QFZ77_005416 [Paenibacillus sp. V4I3]|uniref:Gp138 family membrane-puncturing spike protein n=1 Tax=Paenibacillus sp. V4I3 TaxID=3042305 RepID=UPI002786F4F9|nr:Gp138 family membrane-puncturing spike protein [Paenibacillus sp. V4I3]MDQ0876757.1 hypothetical protein [Paenibacillus sp. V4I3]